jgi:hypothetical protein
MRSLLALKTVAHPTAVIALLGLLALPALAVAQSSQPSLAEIARKEAERRKTAKEAKIVITDMNLPESARKPASTAAPADANHPAHAGEQKPAAAAGAAPGGDASAKPAAPAGDQGEAFWRGKITQAREELRRNEVFLQALQTRVNSLATDYFGRDDPYQKMKLADERQQAIQEMEKVKADIESSKKQVADIEEEARKAGVPPGWLR